MKIYLLFEQYVCDFDYVETYYKAFSTAKAAKAGFDKAVSKEVERINSSDEEYETDLSENKFTAFALYRGAEEHSCIRIIEMEVGDESEKISYLD